MSAALKVMKWLGIGLLVLLAALAVALLLVVQTGPGSGWAAAMAVEQVNARVAGVSIRYEDLSGTLLEGLELRGVDVDVAPEGGARTRVALDRLQFRWNPVLLLDRGVDVQSLLLQGLEVAVTTAPDDGGEPADMRAVLRQVFGLPLSFDVRQLAVQDFALSVDDFRFDAALIESRFALNGQRALLEGLRLESEIYDLAGDLRVGSGNDFPVAGELSWGVESGGLDLEGLAELAGTLQTLRLEHRLQSPLMAASSGTLSPGFLDRETPRFELVHQVDDAAAAIPGVDILRSLSGSLETSGTPAMVDLGGDLAIVLENFDPFQVMLDAAWNGESLRVDSLDIDSPLLAFAANGALGVAPALNLEANWSLNRLDPAGYLPEGMSLAEVQGSGAVRLDGSGEEIAVDLDLESLAASLNGYPLRSRGGLELAGSAVEAFNLAVEVQDNALRLTGSMAPELDVAWELQAPALAVILPGLAGEVSGAGTVDGSLESPQIGGSLAGEGIAYETAQGRYALASFELDASYREGGGDNALALVFSSLRLPLAEASYEVVRGELNLRGEPRQHTLDLTAESAGERLRLTAAGGLAGGGWEGELREAVLRSDYGNLELAAPVMLSASGEAAALGRHCWNGLGAQLCAAGEWRAAEGYAASVALSDLPLVLLNSAQTLQRVEEVELARALQDKPAGLTRLQERFGIQLPPNTFIDGSLALEAEISSLPGEAIPAIEAAVQPSALRLGLLIEEESESQTVRPQLQVFEFNEVDLALARESGLWRGGASFGVSRRVSAGAQPLGTLQASLSLDDRERLGGELAVDFADIGWIEALVPRVADTRGELDAEAEIGGDLSRPLLRARLNLADGGFAVPEYGLDINAIEVDLVSEEENEITVNGSARSGDGTLSFASTISTPLLDSRRLSLQLQGENFQVMNLPDTQVVVNPDLALNLDSERVDIRGDISVPRFLLDLEESQVVASSGAVGVSRDVVVVEAPPEQSALVERGAGAEMVRSLAVTGDITLELGEQVRFSGYGLDLLLDGELEIEMEPDRPILMYGEVTVEEGTYESYGQELSAEGKLIFLGNPANPALDLRAFRQVDNATVGVQMTGTLRNIQGQLYSTPALPESEILAMLVTGRSFRNVGPQDENSLLTAIANFGIERGQGITNTVRSKLGLDTLDISGGDTLDESSLGLGKYITPDLFLRYDIGLFDRESSLSLNYSLTERLRLEVETGVSQSVDLTYTVEK